MDRDEAWYLAAFAWSRAALAPSSSRAGLLERAHSLHLKARQLDPERAAREDATVRKPDDGALFD